MKVKDLLKLFLLSVLCLVMGGCSHNSLEDENTDSIGEKPRKTCKMTFIGGVNGFDGNKPGAKAVSSTWQNGDKIYMTFYNGTTLVSGEAVYSSASGWSVSYDGDLAVGDNQKCEARFFVNATLANSYLVTINPHTEIYEDVNGNYTYDDGELTVRASLTPKTGRIRFTGTSGRKINLVGITTYSTYIPASNQFFTISAAIVEETVSTNGSTSYVYGYFANADSHISIIGDDFAFTRNCTDAVLKVGGSGYMAIPSDASHNKWTPGAYIPLGEGGTEIQMKMIPVAGYNEGFFLMAETETTKQIWDIVSGVSFPSNSTLPKVSVSYSDVSSFIKDINNKTGLQFSLPTWSQWRYAVFGGNKSQRYTYAGSNSPGDVAWYAANTTSLQPVKQKIPNELGLYDMSGNASEWVQHEGSASSYYYYCGGGYKSSSEDVKCSSYESTYSATASGDRGFRLILTCP